MIENQSILPKNLWSVMKWNITPSSLVEIKKWLNSTSFYHSANNINNMLAGHIKYEKSLGRFRETIDCFQQIIRSASRSYLKEIPRERDVNAIGYDSPWVNRQKKYEYNPAHKHTADISYVLWVQIPFYHQDEQKVYGNQGTNMPTNGYFCFQSYDVFYGGLEETRIPSDKREEGTLLMFPSKLSHMVYPFYTSDEDRISIAGNIWVNPKGGE